MTWWVIIGLFAAAIAIWLARWQFPTQQRALWTTGLWVAAWIYVGFAIVGQAWTALPLEILGLLVYGFFAWYSRKNGVVWLAVGWGLHVLWDVVVHDAGGSHFVPFWYPGVCLGFDIAIMSYLLFMEYRARLIN